MNADRPLGSTSDPPEAPLVGLPPRPVDAHKGTFGRVVIFGGSQGMSGAAALAGIGALRSGAGLVQIAVPDVSAAVVAGFEPSYMTVGLPSEDGMFSLAAVEKCLQLAESASAVAVGPGLGQSPGTRELVRRLYLDFPRVLVVDADALNLLADFGSPDLPIHGPRILTPHPGEFARLIQSNTRDVQRNRAPWAMEFARLWGVCLVLKGHGAVVTDGHACSVNATGNPGMATGGSGDVLTGVTAALCAQGMAPLSALRLGVHVHGLAGDLGSEALGQTSLIASDLPRFLPAAFQRMEQG